MDFWLMWYDNGFTVLLMVIGFFLVLFAQIRINSAYSKYRRIGNYKNLTGYEVARAILDANGLSNIEVLKTSGNLTDHYDPSKKLIRLSSDIYSGTSIASMAVAAHECGHAIQDKESYMFFRIRSFLVPIVNFISYLGYFGLIFSLIGGLTGYIKLSILVLFATVVFQLVTLPVEFDASRRGKNQLNTLNLSFEQDDSGIKSVLSAAAMTYVAGLLSSILQLLRLVLILGSRDRD